MVLKLRTLSRPIYGGKVVNKVVVSTSPFFFIWLKNWAVLGGDCSEYYSMIMTHKIVQSMIIQNDQQVATLERLIFPPTLNYLHYS